jgi:hypothetical protein
LKKVVILLFVLAALEILAALGKKLEEHLEKF